MRRAHVRAVTAATMTCVIGVAGLNSAGAQSATTATAYVNADTGKPTANSDVTSGSSCASPDQDDTQAVTSGATAATGNVHVDACLADTAGAAIDGQASFESSGVGSIFKCPDADMAGPKTAAVSGSRCTHSGFEMANSEYHVRLASAQAGEQTVVFCEDPQGDGCADAAVKSTVTITWAPRGGAATGIAVDPSRPLAPVGVAAALAVLAALGLARSVVETSPSRR